MRKFERVLGAVLGGSLAFFGDYPDPLAVLYWLAPIPVLIAVLHSSPRESVLLGALYGLVATGRVWLDFDVAPFAGRFGMSLLFAVIHGWVFWATRRFAGERNEALAPWVYASCVVCSEMIRELPSTGQWWTVAATQVDIAWLRATASLGGSFLISFLVALGAAAVATVLARPRKDTALSALGALAVIGGCVAWCVAHPPNVGRNVRVAAVSVGAPADIAERWYTERIWANADLWTIFERYETATRKAAAAGAELVAWREFGFGVPGSERLRVEERIRALARETGAIVVAGFIDGNEFLNQALVAAPDGTTELYSKKHLVPMAESLWLEPGDRHHGWLEYGDLKVGVLICYDIDFGRSVRRAVRQGANLLVVPSADWPGIHQRHPLQGSLRSAEHAIPLVRPAEGLSTLIDASGAVIGRASDVGQSEVILMNDLSLRGSTTFYTATGNWIFGLSLLALAGAWLRSKRGAGAPC